MSLEMGRILNTLFAPHGDAMSRNLFTLHDIANADVLKHVREHIARTQAAMVQTSADCVASKEGYRASTEEHNVEHESESLAAWVSTLDAALRQSKDRVNQVVMSRSSDGNLRSTFDQAQQAIATWLVDQRSAKQLLLDSIKKDTGLVKVESAKRADADEKALVVYADFRAGSLSEMERLAAEQEESWAVVREHMQKIAVVAEKRTALVDVHLGVTEDEYQRQRIYSEFCAVCDRHSSHLDVMTVLAVESMKAIDSIDTQLEHLVTQMDAKNFDEGLESLKSDELQRYAALFTDYAEASNVLVARRDGRVLVAQRTANVASANAKLTAMSFDPDRPSYVALEAANRRIAADVGTELQMLTNKMEHWGNVFDDVVDALQLINIAVEDPRQQGEASWRTIVDSTNTAVKQQALAEADDADDGDRAQEEAAAEHTQHESERRERNAHRSPPKSKVRTRAPTS
jgi:hypothetical protein